MSEPYVIGRRKTIPVPRDLTGQKFGLLTVLSLVPRVIGVEIAWNCRCDCGVEKPVNPRNMKSGTIKSCGCLKSNIAKTRGGANHPCFSHGKTNTREFRSWSGIKDRCLNPKSKYFKNYGGRGITMHPEWQDSFESFLTHVGEAPSKKHTIDREDNEKGYEPGNVRWATYRQQNNNRRSNKIVEYQGRKQTLTEWGRELGINLSLLYGRSKKNWSAERMFTRPVTKGWREGDPGSIDKHAIHRLKHSST